MLLEIGLALTPTLSSRGLIITHIFLHISANPNGIASFSPGLRGTSYPGLPGATKPTTPTGSRPIGIASRKGIGHNRVAVEEFVVSYPG